MSGPTPDRDDSALAAEYALGLLDATERAAFEARLEREVALVDLTQAWEEHFATLAAEAAPVAPPARLRGEVERQLFGASAGGRRWVLWLGAGAVAATMAAVAYGPGLIAPSRALKADIRAADGGLIVLAAFDEDATEVRLMIVAGGAAPGRSLQLWFIEEGSAPASVGLVVPEARLPIPPGMRARLDGALLAISDEPAGGSPTGAPTGAVLATGAIG